MIFSLAGTPSGKVVDQGFCIHPDCSAGFPEHFQLVELGAVSYAGTSLHDGRGKAIGILAILDDKPFARADFAEYLMSIFAIQAASEMFSMRAEKELRLSKEEWESSFNAIEDLVTIQDKDLRILRANRAAATYLGVGVEYLVGKYCYEVLLGTTEICSNCPEVETLRDGQHHEDAIKYRQSALFILGQ